MQALAQQPKRENRSAVVRCLRQCSQSRHEATLPPPSQMETKHREQANGNGKMWMKSAGLVGNMQLAPGAQQGGRWDLEPGCRPAIC